MIKSWIRLLWSGSSGVLKNRSCHVHSFTCRNPSSFYIRLTTNGKKMGWGKKSKSGYETWIKNERMTEQKKFIPSVYCWDRWRPAGRSRRRLEAGGQVGALIKKNEIKELKMKTNHLSTIAQKNEDGWGMRSWWMWEQLDQMSRWTPTPSWHPKPPHTPPSIPPTQLPPRVSLGEVTEK